MTNCQEIIDYLKTYFTIKTDELHYNITSSNYNPTIDNTVTITVTVTDGNQDPVNNHTFTLDANGTDVELTTNSSGVATYTYTCSTWGACRFSVETYSTLINVTGLKHVVYNDQYQYWYDDHNVYLKINTNPDTVSFPTSFTEFGVQRFLPEALRPKERVVTQTFANTNLLVAVSTDGGIYRRSATGSTVSANIVQAYLQWHY